MLSLKEKRLKWDLVNVCKRERLKKTEPGSSEWYPVNGQEAVRENREELSDLLEVYSVFLIWFLGTG